MKRVRFTYDVGANLTLSVKEINFINGGFIYGWMNRINLDKLDNPTPVESLEVCLSRGEADLVCKILEMGEFPNHLKITFDRVLRDIDREAARLLDSEMEENHATAT